MALGGGVFVQLRVCVFFVKQFRNDSLNYVGAIFDLICYLNHAIFQLWVLFLQFLKLAFSI